MKKSFLLIIICSVFISCSKKIENLNPVDLVNPLVGTDGHGHTFPGATVPFGMVQLSPDTRMEGWDGCGGYHYTDDFVFGFSHTHLSGTGVPDYADVLILPFQGDLRKNESGMPGSSFSHENELAQAGFYATHLDDYGIDVSLTTTSRAGFHKYQYDSPEDAKVYIDLKYRDVVTDAFLQIIDSNSIAGYRHSTAWATDQRLFFYIEFSTPMSSYSILSEDKPVKDISELSGKDVKAFFDFNLPESSELLVKVGISAVDLEGAKNNLLSEIPHWDFKKIKDESQNIWNDELSKIIIKGGTTEQQKVFYTALYHSFIAPNLFIDVDGRYLGHDKEVHQSPGFDNYTVFSLWDTFRAAHPLFTLVQEDRTNDFINTMITQYEQGGRLPVWELAANETDCMIGYHAVPVIVDAFMKGINQFDVEKAYEAMIHSSETNLFGLEAYRNFGFIPAEEEAESVSKTLEYAYDDWCIAQMAKYLNKLDDYQKYLIRAQSYKNIFNPETGFMRARHNGRWFTPFDPREVNFNYTEANAWQYSFFVPQDISTLIQIHGGSDGFESKLDQLFSESTETTGREQSDITGLVGQYAHGNEPSHHMIYLYNYIGKPWKAQELSRIIMNDLYSSKADGLCGNEDCGQMSAWYVMSAMGLYPVTPGDNNYVFGSPLFDEVTIQLKNGKTFSVITKNNSEANQYIQSATLNSNVYNKSYITHSEILSGGELIFTMGDQPSSTWGIGEENIPVSKIDDFPITSVPYLISGDRTFKKETIVELASISGDAEIYFTLDGSYPDENSNLYIAPFVINQTTTLKAIAILNNQNSNLLMAAFNKIDPSRTIKLLTKYENQYAAGGDLALIDHIGGGKDFRTGAWQGYQGVNLEAIVDLGSIKLINKIDINFLQDNNAWIFMPSKVSFFNSNDGQSFTILKEIDNRISQKLSGTLIQRFFSDRSVKARYIKVVAENIGKCPDWHKGAGNPSWIFADEIIIE